MHQLLAKQYVASIKRRASQGDCPTEAPLSVEALEDLALTLDALSSIPEQGVEPLDRSPQHMQGYRHAAKAAVEWLHRRADEMNDPNAKAILNTAAFNLGTDLAHGKAALRSTP